MTKIDQFESAFRSADKPVYEYRKPQVMHVLLVSDLNDEAVAPLMARVKRFLSVLEAPGVVWSHLPGASFRSVGELLEQVVARKPDLVITYRHLHSDAWQWPHGLGEHLDVLIQVTEQPVLVLPHPDAQRALPHALQNTDRVMAVTDQLAGDGSLVDWALRLTASGGNCWLTHIESAPQLERILDVISRIPEIDTDLARSRIEEQLLKEPYDYIESCRQAIEKHSLDLQLEAIVAMGRRLAEYRRLIAVNEIDLLVLNTMDGDQLAMHGQAYPLAVELRQIPLLML